MIGRKASIKMDPAFKQYDSPTLLFPAPRKKLEDIDDEADILRREGVFTYNSLFQSSSFFFSTRLGLFKK